MSRSSQIKILNLFRNTIMNDDNDDKIEDKILDAYMQTFDLVDFDKSGCLDKEELMQWLTMYVLITCFHES